MNSENISAKGASPFKPVWGLVAILMGFCAIVLARSLIWKDIIPWRHDFAAAATEAREKHELRLLDFSSDACDPCEEMKRSTWADKRVAAALKGYVPVRIDFLNEPELDKRFGVNAIPTMIVVDAEGHVVKATVGGMDAEEFLGWIKGGESTASLQ